MFVFNHMDAGQDKTNTKYKIKTKFPLDYCYVLKLFSKNVSDVDENQPF